MSKFHSMLCCLIACAVSYVGHPVCAIAQPVHEHQPVQLEGAVETNAIVQVELDGAIGTGVVICIDQNNPVGDGFAGFCLTAEHVVAADKGRRAIRVKYKNGRVSKRCKVISSDAENDVALLWVWVPKGIQPAPVAKDPVGRKELVQFAGLGGGAQLQCCIRQFEARTAPPTTDEKIFAPVSLLPGDSGGPVFNRAGEVLGVISGGWLWYAPDQTEPAYNRPEYSGPATWPARACNVGALQKLVTDAVGCFKSDKFKQPASILAVAESP